MVQGIPNKQQSVEKRYYAGIYYNIPSFPSLVNEISVKLE